MKFKITMKDPDGVYNSITDAAVASIAAIEGLSEDERETLEEGRRDEINDAASPWVKYGEYLTVEIDTDAGTATVCKA